MIDLSQSTVAYLILSSVILGVLLGVLYDVMRFMKLMLGVRYEKDASRVRVSKAKKAFLYIVTFIFDLSFGLCFAVFSILLTYNISGGIFRGIVYVGMIGGGIAYYLTLARLVLKLNIKLTRLIKKVLKWVWYALMKPVKAIISLIIKLYHLTIGKVIGKIVGDIRMRQEQQRRKAENESVAKLPENTNKETDRDVTKYRYKQEGRISFAGRRKI